MTFGSEMIDVISRNLTVFHSPNSNLDADAADPPIYLQTKVRPTANFPGFSLKIRFFLLLLSNSRNSYNHVVIKWPNESHFNLWPLHLNCKQIITS